MQKIYFDNASTSPLDKEVTIAMMDVLENHYGNPSSIHAFGRKSRSMIEDARKTVAKIIKASIGEIFFTSSATEANNMVIKRSIIDLGVKTIISSPTEHHCVLHTIENIKKEYPYINIIFLKVDANGRISLDELENHLKESKEKILVSIMYGNNEIGTIHPLASIADLCYNYNALYHCDAVQMVGKYPIDLQQTKLSFLTGTAHKFHGPKGSAFLYMNGDNILSPFIYGGAQERNMRAGTENVAGIVGLAKALGIANEKMEERRQYVSNLKKKFEEGLMSLDKGCYLNNPYEESEAMYHISSVSFPESPTADMLMFNLDIAGIAASSGSACSAGIEEDSHVLVAIKHPPERKTIRFSFSYLNNEAEVDATLAVLKKLL